jgi:hypothetical protein
MSTISLQVHDNFKSFVGSDIAAISAAISSFALSTGAAAKSIGIVHVSGAGELLFSLGYRGDEPGYPVALASVSLGHIDTVHAAGLDALDEALSAAATGIDGIICHELVVDAAGDFTAVFLTHTG